MSRDLLDNDWKISNESFQITTAVEEKYENLVNKLKLFPNNYSLFTAGLAYGVLHNKRNDTKPNTSFIKLFVIQDSISKDVIDLFYYVLDDGRSKSEIWNDMLNIADGGVIALNEIYESNNNFRIPHLIEEAKELWPARMKDLHNINLSKSIG